MPPPLAHLRVVDLTDLRGALAGRILADLGAEVLKVEPAGGDRERRRPPLAAEGAAAGTSLAFLFRHANKGGAVVDLDGGAGRERLARLCDQADVLLENLTPDARERLGLDPAAVRARHPRLVHVAMADCGLSGPRAAWRLEPLPALAACGALFASGLPDRPPCGVPGFLAHDCAAAVAVVGALAAVRERAATGAGQTVEVSVEEAALALLTPWAIPLPDYAAVYPLLPAAIPRDGDGPAVVVPTADGWVRLLAVTPRQLRGLLALLRGADVPAAVAERQPGRPPGSHWSALGALTARSEALLARAVGAVARLPLGGHGLAALGSALAALRALAGARLRQRPRAGVVAAAQRLRVPLAPVNTPRQFVAEEQTRVRGAFTNDAFPAVAGRPFALFPCRLSATPAVLRRGAPSRGEEHGDWSPASPPPGPTASAPRGLTGLRVIDLGVGAVVPEMCRQLAELGADVVKIEPRNGLDFLRRITPEPATPNCSWMFNDTARGRRSVVLDLDDPAGRALALRLCAAADVVAENRTAGVVEAWGLDYAAVRARRPDVVYVSSQGFGRGGPLGAAPAYGPLAAAFAGVSWLWSPADAPYPAGTSLEHPDHFAGRLLAATVLAALEHRQRTGEGQHVECAQSEAAAFPFGEAYLEPEPAARGNASVAACPHGVYPAAGVDRWCAIAVAGDDAFERFRTCLGWPSDPALETLTGRLERRARLDAAVAAWTRVRDAMGAAEALQAVGVSAMPVQGPLELRGDPHLAARGALVGVDDPEIGRARHVGSTLRMSATPAGAAGPAPPLGAHTAEVLAEWLA